GCWCRSNPTGAGASKARRRPGIRPCASSVRRRWVNGMQSSIGSPASWPPKPLPIGRASSPLSHSELCRARSGHQSARMSPSRTVEQALQLAIEHWQAGRPAEAEALCRKIVSAEPRHADALYLLGVVAGYLGRADEAVSLLEQAIAAGRDTPHTRLNL